MGNSYTIKELQNLYLEIIKDFHNYCEDNSLRHYMVGGTLLGAVREKGFIPWDDDVDFAMPRPDYESFLKSYSGSCHLEHYQTNKRFKFPYMKIIHPNVSSVHILDSTWGFCGDVVLAMDVYPIDGVGNNYPKARKHAAIVQRVRHMSYLNTSTDKSPSFIKRTVVSFMRFLPSHWLIKRQDDLMKHFKYDSSNYVTRWRMPSLPDNIVSKETFGEGVYLSFEGLLLPAPVKYDAYLKQVYGDYMKPNQEDKNLRHGRKRDEVSVGIDY